MSVKIMGMVWDLDINRDEKFILLAYADHADHDGTNVFPSIGLIAQKTGYHPRSVKRITKKLVQSELLLSDGEGPMGTNKWKIPLDGGGDKIAPPQLGGDTDVTGGVTKHAGGGDIAMSPDSSLTIIKPSKRLDSRSKDFWVKALVSILDTHYRSDLRGFEKSHWKKTKFGGRQDGKFIIVCENKDQYAWLTNRGVKIAEHALVGVLGEHVEVEFVIEEIE